MSDASTAVEPTTPVEPAAPEGAEAPAGGGEQTDYSAHPVWGRALEAIPEILQGPLIETIRSSEAETQKAIEKARSEATPTEWRELIAEAQRLGVSVDDLAGAYRGQSSLQQLLTADPDAFLTEMQTEVNRLVEQGVITRRQGAQAMQQAQQAADDEALLTDEQRELRELKAWRDQQEARQQQEAQQAQARQQQAQLEQQAEQAAQDYYNALDAAMLAEGLYQRGADGRLTSNLPQATISLVAQIGGSIFDSNPGMSYADAAKQAIAQARAAGVQLSAPARTVPPVVGGSTQMPAQANPNAGQPRDMNARAEAALAEALRLQGE